MTQNYALLIGSHRGKPFSFEKVFPFNKSPHELSGDIKTYLGNDHSKEIFLDIEELGSHGVRQVHPALDILFYLRCEHTLKNPIICCGFEPLSAILSRKPENFILCSPRTYYTQLPFEKDLPQVIEGLKASDTELTAKLKRYIKGVFSVDQFRHREANWWGIQTQWEIHKYIHPAFDLPLPVKICEQNEQINNVVARYLFLSRELNGNFNTDEIKEMQAAIKKRDPNIVHIDDQSNDGWSEIFQHIIYGAKKPDRFKAIAITRDDTVDTVFKTLDAIFETSSRSEDEPEVILLDVRLFPEKDDYIRDVSEQSGPQLLNRIRKKFLGIPVIITTASNKVWTYQRLMLLGADAYWIKEGLDEQKTGDESIENYARFLTIMSNLLNDKYKLLKSMTDVLKIIQKQKDKHWWEDNSWKLTGDGKKLKLKSQTTARKEDLVRIYMDGIELFREFISKTLMDAHFTMNLDNDWFYYSSIIVHFGKALELIHNLTDEEFHRIHSFKKVMLGRTDSNGQALYRKRNEAAHSDRSKHIGFAFFKGFILDINKYLLTKE